MKNCQNFLSEKKIIFLVVKFSVYLKRQVFVMIITTLEWSTAKFLGLTLGFNFAK